MLQLRSIIKPADNTGAKRLKLIHIYGGSRRRYAHLADKVLCVVDGSTPYGLVKDRQKVKAIIVRTKKEQRRKDGSYIRFDDNAAVIIDNNGLPVGSRVFGPIAREVKEKGYKKIASLAEEIY